MGTTPKGQKGKKVTVSGMGQEGLLSEVEAQCRSEKARGGHGGHFGREKTKAMRGGWDSKKKKKRKNSHVS